MSISESRYLFTKTLAYKLPHNKKKIAQYLAIEAIRFMPLVSIILEQPEYEKFSQKREAYTNALSQYKINKKNKIICKRPIFETSVSRLIMIKHIANMLGLGILIFPFRLVATLMRYDDKKNGRKCNNRFFRKIKNSSGKKPKNVIMGNLNLKNSLVQESDIKLCLHPDAIIKLYGSGAEFQS